MPMKPKPTATIVLGTARALAPDAAIDFYESRWEKMGLGDIENHEYWITHFDCIEHNLACYLKAAQFTKAIMLLQHYLHSIGRNEPTYVHLVCELYAIAIGIKNSDWKSGLEMASLDWKNFQIGPKLSDKTTVTRAIELLTKALNQAASTQATAESKSRRLLGKYLVQIAPIILNFQSSLTLSADFFMIAGRTIFDPDDEKCLTYCFELLEQVSILPLDHERKKWLSNIYFSIGRDLSKKASFLLASVALNNSLKYCMAEEPMGQSKTDDFVHRLLLLCECLSKSDKKNEIPSVIRAKIVFLDFAANDSDDNNVLQLQRLIRFYVKYSAFENSYTGLYSLFPSWNQLSLLKAEKTAFDSHSKKMENNLRMGYEKIVENIMRRMNPLHQNLNDDDLLFWAQCLDSWCTSALKAEKARLICIDFLSAIISQIAKKARITDILSARKTQFDSYLLEIYSFSCFQAGTNQLCRQNDLIKLLDHTSRLWSLMHDRWNVLPQLASVSAVWRLSESLEKHGLYQSANLILQLIQKSPLTKQDQFHLYYKLFINYQKLGDAVHAEQYCLKAQRETASDSWLLLKSFLMQCIFYCSLDKIDKSEAIFQQIEWRGDIFDQQTDLVHWQALSFHVKAKIFDLMGLLGAAIENLEHSFSLLSDHFTDLSISNSHLIFQLLLETCLGLGQLYHRMGSVKQALHFFDQGKRLANNSGFVFLDQLFAANLRLLWIQTGFERELIQPIYSDMRFFASLDLCTLLLINTTSCILQAKNDSAFRWIAKAESCVEYLIERKDNCSWARQNNSCLLTTKKMPQKALMHFKLHIESKKSLISMHLQKTFSKKIKPDYCNFFHFTAERAEDFYARAVTEIGRSSNITVQNQSLRDLQKCLAISYLCSPAYLYRKACDVLSSVQSKHKMQDLIFHIENGKSLTYQREILRQLGKKLFPIEKLHWPSNEFNDFLSESSTCNNPFLKTLFSFHSISIEENSERFIPSITQNLPPNWRVISATLNQQKTGIFFAVFLRDRQPFFVFRQLTGNFNDFHSQLTDILNKNDQISREGVFCRQKADKKRWWESRKRLDNELKDLVENIQITFVGALDVLFMVGIISYESLYVYRDRLEKVMSQTLMMKKKKTDHFVSLEWAEIFHLCSCRADTEISILTRAFISSTIDECMEAPKINLFIQKLKSMDQKLPRNADEFENILILDKDLQMFPWESFPSLRKSPTCRLPALNFLRDRLIQPARIRPSKERVYFLLNPSGDLANTQLRFEKTLCKNSCWSGIIGDQPSEEQMREALVNFDVFLYFGHSGGEQYLKGSRVRALENCAVSLLFGCSSGKLKHLGEFDPVGTPIDYLIGNSPAVVANLWDVTDKDIDRIAEGTLNHWGLFSSDDSMTLSAAISKSRDLAVLKYLTGAAPVVYGVPVRFRGSK